MLLCEYFACDGTSPKIIDPEKISDYLEKKTGMLWLDITGPTEEDLKMLVEEFGFHQLAIDDLRQREIRPKVIEYPGYTFLTAHEFRAVEGEQSLDKPCVERSEEVHSFISHYYCVTVHDGKSLAVDTARKRWETYKEIQGLGPYAFFYLILDSIVDDYFPAMDAYDERIDTLEHLVLRPASEEVSMMSKAQASADARKPLQALLTLRRNLLETRRYIAPLRDAVNAMLRHIEAIEDEKGETNGGRADRARALFAYYQDVYDHTIRVVDTIDTYRDLLSGTLDAHLAVASNRLNEIVKVLTSVSIILMTWATISGVYGMNFVNMPELHWKYGYPYALALFAITGVLEWVYFRKRRWL